MPASRDSGDEPGGTTVETALDRYLDSLDAGGTRNTLRWVLRDGEESFLAFLDAAGVEHVSALDVATVRDWGRALGRRTDAGAIAPSTAHTYFAYVRAFLSFCVRDRLLDSNPARTAAATEFLPEDTGERDRQFWDADTRESILAFVDRRVDDARTDHEESVETPARDRALVTLLALAGVRGAEVFRDPNDDLRDGLRWADVALDRNSLRVLGKSREYEGVALVERVRTALADWRGIQDPPTDEWPVFPTGHAPSKRRALDDAVGPGRAQDLLADRTLDEALRAAEVPPPSISKNGARNLMQRLCAAAGVDVDGEYLKPHGGRRGLGHSLYASGRPVVAQGALRHQSIQTTHEAYADLQPAQVADQVEDALEDGPDS